MKAILQRYFPWAHEALMRQYAKRVPRSEVFSRIYRENGWDDPESRSGVGSRMDETRVVRSVLPGLLRELGVRTMLDAPCGDRNWIQHVELGAIDYRGADIVPELIAENTRRFPQYRFQVLDLVTGPIPEVDLVLCRDCLVHLSLKDAARALSNIAASGSRYLLSTTFAGLDAHTDIIIGWRRLDLQKPPFSLPAPLRMIDEASSEQSDKRLGLWDLHALS
ncbi:MAG: hypothetical protein RL030_2156 [Pseudomonadota bacterium]